MRFAINSRSHDRDVAHFVGALQAKIDELAERAGVSDPERLSMERMLAALPWRERRRVSLILKGAKAQSENSALHDAVDLLAQLASEVWKTTPVSSFKGMDFDARARSAAYGSQARN